MDAVILLYITIRGIATILSNKSPVEKIEKWLFLLVIISLNILARLM